MCGLIGVNGTADAAREVYVGLLNLQHRGQDGAGILTCGGAGQFSLQKGSGLVENVFSEQSFKGLKGHVAIGHTRYATIGKKDPNLLQPFLDYQAEVGIAHNGNIVNCYQIARELEGKIEKPTTDSDSELILKLVAHALAGQKPNAANLFGAIRETMQKLVGSYAVVGLDAEGGLWGFRDPHGIRPLLFGSKLEIDGRQVYALASETVALAYLGYGEIQEVQPGEAIYIDKNGVVERQILRKETHSPCMFEWVYFARVESAMSGISVYEARFKLGLLLSERIKDLGITADLVLPVPETSRAAAIALAESLDIPYRELLIKNRYVNRTFILDDQKERQTAISRKLYAISEEIKGKRCIVVDDSIVRGNTAAKIIELMKHAGAKEVILVSTCPPIAYPCYYGIDFPSHEELVAGDRTDEEVAAALGADRVVYQTLVGLKAALAQKNLCTGCLTNEYPTDVTSGLEFQTQRSKDRKKAKVK
jgi:amidophosphoribosyltransferase